MAFVFPSINVQDDVRGDEFNYKAACRLASAQNANWTGVASAAFASPTLTLSALTAGATLGLIDSVEPTTGDRILLKDMAAISAGAAKDNGYNGIWQVTGGTTTSVTLIRAYDLLDGDNPLGVTAWVKQGTLTNNTAWICTTSGVTVASDGTNDFTFTQYDVRDTLSIARGGTGATSLSPGNRIIQTNAGATALETTTTPVATQILDTNLNELIIFTATGSAVNEINIANAATGNPPVIRSSGEANIGLVISDSNSNELLTFGSTASAVNNIRITNSATGVRPTIRAEGEANTGLIISDTNSNELVTFSSVASAVNQLNILNAATGVGPTLRTEGETNVDMNFQTAGNGVFAFDAASGTASAIIRMLDNTGGEYGALTVPATVSTSFTLILPNGVGSAGQALTTDGNNPAALSWTSVATAVSEFTLATVQITANSTTATQVAQFAWNAATFGGFTTNTVVFWYESVTNRNLIVEMFDVTNAASLGSTTIVAPAANGIGSFTFSDPVGNARIAIRVSKNAGAGTNPNIFGIYMRLT